jgi:2-polyprenyl-3-methyl-5-hydroxy-6-metoxy-1,4-benzoquinol methylase
MPEPLFIDEDTATVGILRARLDRFYDEVSDYAAFHEASGQSDCWRFVIARVGEIVSRDGSCRVLEIGAGRSGFGTALGALRAKVHYAAQDVTARNGEWLRKHADAVHIGNVQRLRGEFDVIFSTYVLEHVTDPRAVLLKSWSLLRPNGSLFVFCPRYDVPLYVPRSLRHHSRGKRLWIALQLSLRRVKTLLRRRAAFLIVAEPAAFAVPWQPDVDAVHLVSTLDLKLLFEGKAEWKTLRRSAGTWRDWVTKNLLTLNVELRKPVRD